MPREPGRSNNRSRELQLGDDFSEDQDSTSTNVNSTNNKLGYSDQQQNAITNLGNTSNPLPNSDADEFRTQVAGITTKRLYHCTTMTSATLHSLFISLVVSLGKENSRDLNYYLPLYKASLRGDWDCAKEFFRHDPESVNKTITSYRRTALHVAAGAGHSEFAKNLVELMSPETIALKDSYNGDTALHFASIAGMTDVASAMVDKNKDITQVQNDNGWTPLLLCAAYATREQKDMIEYLCTVTRNEQPSAPFSGHEGAQLICNVIAAGLHDLALYLVQRYPNLATERDQNGCSGLDVLAQKCSLFPSGTHLGFWQRCIYSIIPMHVDERHVTAQQIYPSRTKDSSFNGVFMKFLSWTYLTE
ncbi:hypothetical protein MKW94_021883, partial [Papaver nudicaule]|nr:hypothetical protein [Papaver nudicaule]